MFSCRNNILDFFPFTCISWLLGYWHVIVNPGPTSHLRPSQQMSPIPPQKWPFSTQAGIVCLAVSPFWTPLIDTSKLRGEANVCIERMARTRTMVLRTILKQCPPNIEGRTFCNKFWNITEEWYDLCESQIRTGQKVISTLDLRESSLTGVTREIRGHRCDRCEPAISILVPL